MSFNSQRWLENAEIRKMVESGELDSDDIRARNLTIIEENKKQGIHPLTGTIQTKKHRQKIGSVLKGFVHSGQSCHNMSLGHLGKKRFPHTEETKAKMKTRQQELAPYYREKSLEQWADPIMRDKMVKAILAGSHLRPTIAEIKLSKLIEQICPGEYEYSGNDSGIDSSIIAGMCPDFTNRNHQKKVIEMFGDYWHSEEVTGRTRQEEEQRKVKNFAAFGFKCLIVWESELSNPEKVLEKIAQFNGNKQTV